MTIPSKDYFIVFEKNWEFKKELAYYINFFYLKSYKQKSHSFSYIKNPFFMGVITLGLDFKEKIRPISFSKIQKDGIEEHINPRLFKKLLLDEKAKFIAFSSQTNQKEFIPIKNMLKSFQFDEKKVRTLTFCESCMKRKIFNILGRKEKILSTNNSIICSECALEVVFEQLNLTGFVGTSRISPKLKNFFNHMILKFRNTEKVLKSFKPDFNPTKNREVTLYDIEKNPQIGKKYLNFTLDKAKIPVNLEKRLHELNIHTLLPIQAISIEDGLINSRQSQLVMAPTSGGKTLVGELAGVSRILTDHLKMLYLVPIVALANVRTEEFENKYSDLKLKIVKKVGESILDKKEFDDLDDLIDADIIIATYEAIDYIFRSGNKDKIGSIGTVIVDEIQTLIDPERGFLLDGLIARLKILFPSSQFLYLSATIGEPKSLAAKLGCNLIKYNNRPVPIERHLILCLNESLKSQYISRMVRSAFLEKSKYGFKGQSIIFTNSRKKCESLSEFLNNKGLSVQAYHSGLTNEERKNIERLFQKQTISGVVATAALAAGVDFPAKQVIFESLSMGISLLTVAEFEQMLGRAGRLGKHDLGLAYLLVEPGKTVSPRSKLTEENLAVNLLNGKIRDYELEPNEDRSLTELLAFISIFNEKIGKETIYEFYDKLINSDYNLDTALKKLINVDLIKLNKNGYSVSQLGRALAKSFLTIENGLEIKEKIRNKTERILEIVLELKPLKNVYLTKKVVNDLSKNINMKYFSNNFFSNSVLNLMDANYVRKRKVFSNEFIDYIIKWTTEIFNCTCKDKPYCNCGRLNLEKIILDLRIENRLSIKQISKFLEEEYKILIYKGDITDYLENLIYSFESILNITKGILNIDSDYKSEISQIPSIIENIKN